VEVEKGVKNE